MLDKFAKLPNKKKIALIILIAWTIFVLAVTVTGWTIIDGKPTKDIVVITIFAGANLIFAGCVVYRYIYGAYKREDLLWFIGAVLLIIGWIVHFFA